MSVAAVCGRVWWWRCVSAGVCVSPPLRHLHLTHTRHCPQPPGNNGPPPAPLRDHLQSLDHIRNIGIMAHIDAGKTTTTERMLFYGGVTRTLGEVHHGDTVMDYLDQERERGITITSAAITLPWADHRINLVDTPGHVDFTMEVERSLRVLDGAVAILDASAGVEAQTLTVWRQADRYRVPRFIYLNKMDKPAASVSLCLSSIRDKLHVLPLLLHLPLGQGKLFRGLVDLVTLQRLEWDLSSSDRGRQYLQRALTPEEEVWDEAQLARCELIDKLADLDTPLAEYVLEQESLENVPAPLMREAVRRVTLSQEAVPVLVGSSYKNVGVQPMMNAVVDFLPSPRDATQPPALSLYTPNLCALAFKIVHDKQRGGILTYLRVYSGCLEKGQRVYNVNGSRSEKLGQVLIAYADHYKEVASVEAGNIVVVTGLKGTNTGDTLVASQAVASAAKKKLAATGDEDTTPTLLGVEVPDPVFFCSVEAPSTSQQKALEMALVQLEREDPSLHVTQDEETGQTVLSGMGELHLEIIRDRIHKEHKVDAELGPLQVAYRETCGVPATHTLQVDKMIGDSRQQVKIVLSISPSQDHKFKSVSFEYSADNQENLQSLRRYHLSAINRGVSSGLRSGPVLGCPVVDVKVGLHWFEVRPGTSETMVAAAAAQCLQQVLAEGGCQLMEPIMVLEIVAEEDHTSTLLADLSRRRANVLHISHRHNMRVLLVECPLAELLGYSTAIRTLSSGTASFSMELSHYKLVNASQQAAVIEAVTGFQPL
ncbi:hypothetical protein O3P69_015843 [Scylla paramamosain]|uniref:Tr-type G domain-containing protein n=1 Tax=Scylla paramamosain TaxID=85552 RepID=A0AAW0T886_SCYPA